uniref:Azaphilone pigments biosynthesis cluster protein L N-terminal domain-containing protein n=1 Tax=Colletotrichum fructicola (strain Nara gc5) TaxID=1213859 RepID=L2FYJ0_COLFN
MADPFSIVTGCVGLITAAGATTEAIKSFIRDCRDARGDLTSVARELADLQLILELLKDDGQGDALPNSFQAQIDRIVKRCSSVVRDIRHVLKRCKAPSGAITWAANEKKEVEALRRELTTYRESLSLTVETTTLFIARSIKADTEVIRNQTQFIPGIKDDTEKILEETQRLRVSHQPEDGNIKRKNILIEEYLDGLTVCAESVCGDEVRESAGEGKTKKIDKTANDLLATVSVSKSHKSKISEVEEKVLSSESSSLKSKCNNCDSHIDEGALKEESEPDLEASNV